MSYTDEQILEIVDINLSKKSLEKFTLNNLKQAEEVLTQMRKYPGEFMPEICEFVARRASLNMETSLKKYRGHYSPILSTLISKNSQPQ